MLYLDSSAIVKLVVREPESTALRDFLRRHGARASCGLARVEVPRAVAASGADAVMRARSVLAALLLVRLDDGLLDAAGQLAGPSLRSLDAMIHLAAAQLLEEDLTHVVTYDRRMGAAAEALGLAVASPS